MSICFFPERVYLNDVRRKAVEGIAEGLGEQWLLHRKKFRALIRERMFLEAAQDIQDTHWASSNKREAARLLGMLHTGKEYPRCEDK